MNAGLKVVFLDAAAEFSWVLEAGFSSEDALSLLSSWLKNRLISRTSSSDPVPYSDLSLCQSHKGQRELDVTCSSAWRRWQSPAVVCALQAATPLSQTWLTDCPEITIFRRLPHPKRIENFSNHQPALGVSGDDTAAFHSHLLTGGLPPRCSGQRDCNHRRRIDKF